MDLSDASEAPAPAPVLPPPPGQPPPQLRALPDLSVLRALRALNLADNSLASPPAALLVKLTGLQYLDLSGNTRMQARTYGGVLCVRLGVRVRVGVGGAGVPLEVLGRPWLETQAPCSPPPPPERRPTGASCARVQCPAPLSWALGLRALRWLDLRGIHAESGGGRYWGAAKCATMQHVAAAAAASRRRRGTGARILYDVE
jgi:hypothetical protein